MRIVGGSAKGRRLRVPRSDDVRPTSDKVREAIFGALQGEFIGQQVLDLFSGSGAMGIEALSRGASRATFVEKSRSACAIVRENLRELGLSDLAEVRCAPVERTLPSLGREFSLVLLDPPYQYAKVHDIMATLGEGTIVFLGGTVVLEHSSRVPVHEEYGNLALRRHKVYGDTAVSMFAVGEAKEG